MANEIKLPELGENLSQGDILEVKVAPGDTVAQGQTLVEIEAEKSTVEVPSPLAGRISKVLVKKGDTVSVGQTFCLIEGADGENDGAKSASVREAASGGAEPEPKAAARQAEIVEPAESGGDAAEQPGVTPVPAAPPPREDGQEKKANKPTPGPLPEAGRGEKQTPPSLLRKGAGELGPADKVVSAGPATRRLARELGVDLNQVPGTAPGERVTQEDIKAYVRDLTARTGQEGTGAPPLPDFERWGPVDRQALPAIRRKTAEQVSLAWRLAPHVTQHDQADITDLDAFRRQQEGRGPKLTVTAFVLKAAAIALKQYPQFNASLDSAAGQLIIKKYIHIGVAVDTERGLLVPVLRDVDKKGVLELAQELADLAEKARQKKLQADDMKGSTFTITNLGGIGGTGFTPIINYPEVAILGISRAMLSPALSRPLSDATTAAGESMPPQPVQVVPRLLLPLSLSYDHRVIDGADAARFTRRLAEMLENPLLMLLPS
jgi:pyruvate dehydrogenase E2 component (dihydrolipoamide acetyltransferase)